MTIEQISLLAQSGAVGLLVILLGLVKIPYLELNLWSWIGRAFGRAINGEIIDEVKKIDKKLEEHMKEEEEDRTRNIRQRILRFNDEILMGKKHSKEHFDEILSDIDVYERFCLAHPDYKNNKAVLAIYTIKEVYRECTEEHSFLIYTKKPK